MQVEAVDPRLVGRVARRDAARKAMEARVGHVAEIGVHLIGCETGEVEARIAGAARHRHDIVTGQAIAVEIVAIDAAERVPRAALIVERDARAPLLYGLELARQRELD